MIPKVIHYVWVGGPLPPMQQDCISSWRETNPDFEIVRWDERNIDFSNMHLQQAYKEKKWAKVADFARLDAVAQLGGIYLDTDIKLIKPLERLLDKACFFSFQEKSPSADWVCNGVFGAEPQHWFVRRAREDLYGKKQRRLVYEKPTTFGPKHLTRLLVKEGLSNYAEGGITLQDIFIAPTPMFFPFHYTEQYSAECITPETLGIHFWEKSWASSIPFPVRMAKRCINLARGFNRRMPSFR
jgi:mannosyltransferase OCH1-like enzyme